MRRIVDHIDGEHPMFVFSDESVAPCGDWGKEVFKEIMALRWVAQIAQDGMRHISLSAEREYNYTERIEKLLNGIA